LRTGLFCIMMRRMKTLSKLFSTEGRVKVMRLFLFNPETSFVLEQIIEKAKISKREAETELDLLVKSEMVKVRKSVQIVSVKHKGKMKQLKKKIDHFQLDEGFEYLLPLQNLLINTRPLRKEEIMKRLSSVGKLKMVIVAGVFTQNPESRVDLLIVGDNLKKGSMEKVVRNMEAEIGKELTFASFETADFHYRLGMYDKLIRDILDYPHQKLLDKLGLKL
jgi:hypothetical protein